MHELYKRLLQHGQLKITGKKFTFKSQTIHGSKSLLKFYRYGTCLGYWYIDFNGQLFEMTHGNTKQDLVSYSKLYFAQFERKVPPRKARV